MITDRKPDPAGGCGLAMVLAGAAACGLIALAGVLARVVVR